MTDLQVALQAVYKIESLPDTDQIESWVKASYAQQQISGELTIRVVDEQESAALNQTWRAKQGPTNILSFNYKDEYNHNELLGDLVLCGPVVEAEAHAQNKPIEAHWAHLIVHGCLHLQGFDHINNNDAEIMENKERLILAQFGYPDPYQTRPK